MKNETENKTALDILHSWRNSLSDDKYLYRDRKTHIGGLAEWLKEYGISFDEAKSLRDKVLLTLTTAEGRKGKGKYKGWKESVLLDFDDIIAGTYVSEKSETIEKPRDVDSNIIEWLDKKYTSNDYLVSEAHRIGTVLNLEFLDDFFGKTI